ncbi:xanthine dehydrogenase family protein molybdopterin-binding subunit [candidate division KSB1 bacterium]|nr:xanthine dehydrogenase family protein molybdopterin-binding subunit [candidate division KSB1 bacterium]
MKKDNFLDLDFTDHLTGPGIKRRDFLKTLGGGIFILMTIAEDTLLAQRRPLPTDFNAFLRIGEDGRVACFTGKIEMGQGVITSLAQMLADELDVALESVDMVMGDTDLCPWDMGTFGSMSTRFFGPPLRAAGAEGRQVLLELAAERLNLPVDRLATENGVVYSMADREKKVTYAQLTKGKKIARHASGEVPIKKPEQFKIMNRPVLHRDAREKVTGRAKYAGDIQLPGMLYARILRPPSHDSKRISVDLSEAKKMEGVQVVEDGDLVAVLHRYPDMAEKALNSIKAEYDTPESELNEKTIFDHLLKVAPEGEVVDEKGDLNKGRKEAATIIENTYLDGYKAHAPIEPHTAVVHVEGNKATVWPSSQTPFGAKDEVAEVVGIPAENVHVISPFVGGGFGGKSRNLQVSEAARLSKLTGKPVQVAWTRAEEFFYDSFRPAAIVKIKSGIDGNGGMNYWDYHVYFAGERGSQHFYSIPNSSTIAHSSGWGGGPGTHPFATGAWRAPGNNTNTFARESQIDIMAAAAGMDPVEFRLKNLTDEKFRNLLKAASEKFNWKPAKAPSGHGYGVACGIDAGTSVVTMAEVAVDKKTGKVTVKRVVSAQDMGLSINPQGAAIQMEGCTTMGLGYALAEDIHFKGGQVLDLNFDTYEIPRFSWLPEIETVIIDAKNEKPQGGGEPAIITMGAVIANAIYDAVGVRLLQMPLTADSILEELRKM